MKKISVLVIGIFLFSFVLIVSCSDSDSSNNKDISLMRGPDECNQDEYEDESKDLSTEIEEECVERQVANVPANKDILYSIRDSILNKSPRGKRYIDEYYLTSGIEKDYKNFTIENFVDVIDLMPNIYEAHNKFLDPTYNGVIVSTDLKIKLIKVLNAYKKLSTDANYISIIDSFIIDVNNMTNRDKNDVVNFMQN
jgi:hypothetical protein